MNLEWKCYNEEITYNDVFKTDNSSFCLLYSEEIVMLCDKQHKMQVREIKLG